MTLRVPLGAEVFMARNGSTTPGGIFLIGDDWPASNSGFSNDPDISILALNAIQSFCGPGPKRLWLARGTGYYGSSFQTAMTDAGHSVHVEDDWITLSTANYDFAFVERETGLAGSTSADKMNNLIAFVLSGGGAYVDFGQGAGEDTTYATLLDYVAVTYSTSYVYTSNHHVAPYSVGGEPIFSGVGSVYMVGAGTFDAVGTPTTGATTRFQGNADGEIQWVFAVWRP